MEDSRLPGAEEQEFADFDHREAGHREGAECRWARMRRLPGLPRSERYGGFRVVTRYPDLAQVLLDHQTFSSARGISFPDLDFGTPLIPAEVDPPEQKEYRRLLARFLTRERVRKLEPELRAAARSLLGAIDSSRPVEIVSAFARPFPIQVALHLLDLPAEDGAMLDALICELHESRGSEAAASAAGKLGEYIAAALERCARTAGSPDEGILASIALGEVDGARLSLDEQLSMVRLLMFGGFDTTALVLSCALWWLAGHPEDAERLRSDPSLMPTAIEEFVRFASPATYLRRTVTHATELGGSELEEGDRVLLCFAAANRDPDQFEDPDRLAIDRSPNRHAGFGLGVHRCIGFYVAQLEIRVALEEILGAYDSIALDPESPIEWTSGENQGIGKLTLRLGAA